MGNINIHWDGKLVGEDANERMNELLAKMDEILPFDAFVEADLDDEDVCRECGEHPEPGTELDEEDICAVCNDRANYGDDEVFA